MLSIVEVYQAFALNHRVYSAGQKCIWATEKAYHDKSVRKTGWVACFMGKTKHGALVVLEKNIEVLAGESVAKKVMEGSEEITEKTDKRKTAEWVKNAVKKLDALVDEDARIKIMENCGYNCAEQESNILLSELSFFSPNKLNKSSNG